MVVGTEDARSPWWLLVKVVLWFVVVEIVVGTLLGVGLAVSRGALWLSPALVKGAAPLLALGPYWLVLRHEGRRVGNGDVVAGLGLGPVKWRMVVMVGLPGLVAVQGVVWLLGGVSPWLGAALRFQPLTAAQVAALGGTAGLLMVVLWAVLVAPVLEELMFRGWLWTGLRRRWGVVATVAASVAMFALAHVSEGGAKAILVVPLALLLGVVRQISGGVRGTMVLHAINNGPVLVGAMKILVWGTER